MTQSIQPLDAKQRYAADAMMAVIRKAISAMADGKSDPAAPYSWENYGEFQLYMELVAALDAARVVHLGQPPFFEPNCATCLHFKHHESDRADESPVDMMAATSDRRELQKSEADALEIGVCTANSPMRSGLAPRVGEKARSHFPRVHRDMVCGQWAEISRRGRLG